MLAMHLHLSFRDAEAVEAGKRSLAIEHDNAGIRSMTSCHLGLATARLGRVPEALEHHRRSVTEAEASGMPNVHSAAELGFGETALRVGAPAAEHTPAATGPDNADPAPLGTTP